MIFDETPVSDGLAVIEAMLICGLIFLAVIALGEIVRAVTHRRHDSKPRAHM
jgi:hypothetical protein